MKKVISVFLAVLMAMNFACLAVNAEEVECEHEFGKWIISQDETCAEPGIKYRQCSLCGAVETGLVPALGHSYGEKTVVEPTCASEGYTSSVCANCSNVKKENFVAKLSHTYSEWVVEKEATCEEDGLKTRSCSACNMAAEGHTQAETIPALDHDMKAGEVVAPGYTDGGYTVYDCTRCDKTEKRDFTPVLKGRVESVDLGEKIVVNYEQVAKIDPQVRFAENKEVNYTTVFKSGAENVATVDENGNVIGKGMGKTTITCTVTDEYGNVATGEVEVQVKFTIANWFTLIGQVLKAAFDIVIKGLFGSLM